MKKFMDENFLLQSDVAIKLYHDYAKDMPIFDYHNHLNAKEIYDDLVFENISKVWLGGDHYKWRLMRTNGIDEEYITGNKTDYEKFLSYAKTISYSIGNPLYHWSHLELQRYFDVYEPLNEANAKQIYDRCNTLLQEEGFSVRNLIIRSNVKAMCTTDDPKDDLKYHKLLAEEGFACKVLPTFRPDNILHTEKPGFLPYISALREAGYTVNNLKELLEFLVARMDYFHDAGCRLSDHALDVVMYLDSSFDEASLIFDKSLNGKTLMEDELRKYKGYVMSFLGKEYHSRGWVQQYHIGPMRNNSTRMLKQLGPDTGFDSINDRFVAQDLSRLLDNMDSENRLPKTILYCINPSDNAVLATMLGNFQGGGIEGKIQFGSGWWFMDTKPGMIKQMEDLASMGMLCRFVGMLTDSRSFLSFPRHEYFRRIMCNEIAKLVVNGEYPEDYDILSEIVQGICYNNVAKYISVSD